MTVYCPFGIIGAKSPSLKWLAEFGDWRENKEPEGEREREIERERERRETREKNSKKPKRRPMLTESQMTVGLPKIAMSDTAEMSLAWGLALVRFITGPYPKEDPFWKPRGKANTISAFNGMACYVRVQVPFSLSDKSSYVNFILSSYFAFGG